jgi:poly(3-hydroxybutyrate) depolymerase
MNKKKVLSLLLCLAMCLTVFGSSLGVVAASDYPDNPDFVSPFVPPYGEDTAVGEIAKGYMEWQGIPRMYEYYVPTSYTGKRMPLMVLIPGSGESSASRLANSHFVDEAEASGFIVVAFNPVVILSNSYRDPVYADVQRTATKTAGWVLYSNASSIPEGTARYLNGSAGYTAAQAGVGSGDVRPNAIDLTGEFLTETIAAFEIDDVGYICALVDRFVTDGYADKNRVFASGLSHGAYMALRLAAERPDVFAGIAPVAGLLDVGHQETFDGTFDPATDNKVKLVFVQGDADAIVPPGAQLKTAAQNNGPDPINDGRRPLFDIKGDPPGLYLPYGINDPGGSQGLEETIDWFMKQYGFGDAVKTNEYDIPQVDIMVPGVSTTGGSNVDNLPDITDAWRYEYNDGRAIVYWIKGGGHSWPGGTPANRSTAQFSTVSYQIDATKVIMDDLWIELTDEIPAVSVRDLGGESVALTISVTKVYDNGKQDVVSNTFTANKTATGVYEVDDCNVFVGTEDGAVLKSYIVGNQSGLSDQVVRALSLLESAIGFAAGSETSYTPASWAIYESALNVAYEMVASPENYTYAELIAAYHALVQATQGLEYSLTESLKGILANYVVHAEDVFLADEDRYLAVAIENLKETLTAAKTVLDDPNATQDAIEAATDALLEAIKQMHEKPDKTALSELTDIANGANYAETTYTPATWAVLADALLNAEAVLTNGNAILSQVQEAYDALFAAMTGLTVRANFAGLEALIAQAQIILAHSEDYVESTLAGLAEETAGAVIVFNDKNSTRTQVGAAQAALASKVVNARLKADTSSILNALGIVSALNLNAYTSQSVQPLSALIAEAQAILSSEVLTEDDQGMIDALAEGILQAINSLVRTDVAVRESAVVGTPSGGNFVAASDVIADAVRNDGAMIDIPAVGDVGAVANGSQDAPSSIIEQGGIPLAGSDNAQSNANVLSWIIAVMALIILGLILMLLKKPRVENKQ